MLLTTIFPGYADWFNISSIVEYAASDKGYTSSGDLNRLNAFRRINELWLTNGWSRMFGMGLGNCDTSAYAMLNTPFFVANGDMHYTWFSHAMMYLETGWIGLIFFWGFIALVYFRIRYIEKNSDGISVLYCRGAKIMAVLYMLLTVYNSSLRMECGYMVYIVLAIPFACQNNVLCVEK